MNIEIAKKQKERWLIFLLVIVILLIPILFRVKLKPAPMLTATKLYEEINSLKKENQKIVVVAMDWGSGTAAENEPQTRLIVENLLRKKIPFAVVTLYNLGEPFLDKIPKEIVVRLKKENPDLTWEYGKDWINFGYLPNGIISVQGLAKSDDWAKFFNYIDAYGSPLDQLPIMKQIKTLKDVEIVVEMTGLTGVFSTWLQFFQTDVYSPKLLHGCTSITIPEAFIYFSSGQLKGFFEGIAGAAYYEKLLNEEFPKRDWDYALSINTGTSYAQILVIFLIVIGNLQFLLKKRKAGVV